MEPSMNKYLLITLTASVMLTSCDCEEGGVPNEPASLLVKEVLAGSETGSATRTAATSELTSGSIGVFRAKDTGASPVYPTECNNYKYAYNSGWKPADAANTIYLTGKDVEVCAYYPYNSDAAFNDKTALPLTSAWYKSDAPSKDLCYATDQTVNATAAKRSVSFTMKHAMALLELVFYFDAGSGVLNIDEIKVSNPALVGSAKFDITTGTQKEDVISGSLTTSDLPSEDATTTVSALLVPFDMGGSGLKLEIARIFVIPGSGYVPPPSTSSVTIPATLFGGKLEAGKRYRVKIAANGMVVTEVRALEWTANDIGSSGNPYPI